MKYADNFLITSVSPFYLGKDNTWYIDNYTSLYSIYLKKN